jgi:hypothetical protein
MFRWYRDAVKCYVYLSNVLTRKRDLQSSSFTPCGLAPCRCWKVCGVYDRHSLSIRSNPPEHEKNTGTSQKNADAADKTRPHIMGEIE